MKFRHDASYTKGNTLENIPVNFGGIWIIEDDFNAKMVYTWTNLGQNQELSNRKVSVLVWRHTSAVYAKCQRTNSWGISVDLI